MADKRARLEAGVKRKLNDRTNQKKTDLIGRKKQQNGKGSKKNNSLALEGPQEDIEDEMDDFDSEMAEPDDGPLMEEETTDEKRIRLAKQVINEAKMLRKREELERDNEDEDEALTGILQNGIVGMT
jgi:hypothetical protein